MSKVIEKSRVYNFKHFDVHQQNSVMRIAEDGILLGAWTSHSHSKHILDIGTGTGILALMMAQKYPDSSIVAVDIDPEACKVANNNFEQCLWAKRLKVTNHSIQDFSATTKFDIIICNPPFYNRNDLTRQSVQQGISNAVKMAHGDLLRKVSELLSQRGAFNLILSYLEGLRFIEMAEMYDLYPSRITEVYPDNSAINKNRLIIQFQKDRNLEIIKDKLVLQNSDGSDSHSYLELIEKFC